MMALEGAMDELAVALKMEVREYPITLDRFLDRLPPSATR
jgi:hypothetical protein